MKNIFKRVISATMAAFASAVVLTGCWGLDYLPKYAITEDTFLDRASDVTKLVTGVYGQMKNAWCFGYDFLFDSVTDIAVGDYFQNYAMGISSYSDGWFQNCWQQTYNLAQTANAAIRNLQNATAVDPNDPLAAGKITTTMRDQAIAECQFLRALAYFRLTCLFGDVPYYDESWNLSETFSDMGLEPSSAADVRTKCINDLTSAINVLPDSWPAANYGRATKTAAYAIRGKIKLYGGDNAGAISDFEWVVNNGLSGTTKVALDPSYRNLFRVFNGGRSPEMIFSIQNSNVDGMATTTLMGNKASLRQIPTDRMNPSVELIDKYEKKDGTKFNWDEYLPGWNNGSVAKRTELTAITIDADPATGVAFVDDLLKADTAAMARAYRERDPRLMAVAITPYSTYLGTNPASNPATFNYYLVDRAISKVGPGEGSYTLRNWNNAFNPSYFCRKFVIEGAETGGEYSHAPYEWPIIRLGDIFLMLAEAYNNSGNDTKACEYLNKVRARVDMPGVSMTGTALRDYIRDERARELPFEGHRFFDIRRWGIGSQVVTGDANTIWGNKIYTRSYPAKHDIWPIPQVELDRNPLLKSYQKQGW